MRRSFFLLLAILCVFGAFQSTKAAAASDPDPQIGQPAVGYKLQVTKFDNTEYNSVLQDCGSANKIFIVMAKIKRGTPGKFIQAASSSARFKATTGEVMTSPAYRSVSKRRIAFMVSSAVSSGATMIDKDANNHVIVATNDPRAEIILRPAYASCVFNG